TFGLLHISSTERYASAPNSSRNRFTALSRTSATAASSRCGRPANADIKPVPAGPTPAIPTLSTLSATNFHLHSADPVRTPRMRHATLGVDYAPSPAPPPR